MTINSNTAFVSDNTGVNQIDVVDITTPTAMTNLSRFSTLNTLQAGHVAVPYGNYLLIPSGGNVGYGGSIQLYDMTNRSSPVSVSTTTTPASFADSPFGGIAISNGYIFAGDYGVTPGNTSSVDVFTMPQMSIIAGSETVSNVTVTNSLTGTVNYSPAIPGNWSPVPTQVASALDQLAARTRTTNTVATDFSIPSLTSDYILNVNDAGGVATITLPTAASSAGFCADVKNLNGANTVSIVPPSGTIDGQVSLSENQYDSYHLCSVGGGWYIY